MKPFTVHRGRVAPLDRVNVDTDQIIPKQFLKRIERTGFGQFLFYDWRFGADGKKNADFVLDDAVWALADFGFRAVISFSFADIFANNSTKNGFLTVQLSESQVVELLQRAQGIDARGTVWGANTPSGAGSWHSHGWSARRSGRMG